jgi:hypothetical protein
MVILKDNWKALKQFLVVCGTEDPHSGQETHDADVVDCLVRWSVTIREKSRDGADEFDGKMGDGHIITNELECPEREKRRQGVDDRSTAPKGKPCRSADHRLFADTDIDESIADRGRQTSDSRAVLRCQDDNPVVTRTEIGENMFVRHLMIVLHGILSDIQRA